MPDIEEVLVAQAVLGHEAREFLASDIGRYLLGRADQDESEALEKLATVAWWRRRRILSLQNQVYRARSVRNWLAELVIDGQQAESVLEDREQ